MTTRVLIVDDHEVVREGLRTLLTRRDGMEVVGQAANVQEAIAEAAKMKPDVIVMDVRLPDGSGIEACREIREARPETKVIMLTSYADEEAVFASIIAGAPGPFKRRLGFFAYVVAALRAFIRLEKFAVRLTVDGEVKEMRASAVLIANFGAVMNDLIAFGDGIQRDDGLLNACVYSPGNALDAARILFKMTFRRFTPDPCIHYASGSSFVIETDPPRLGQADGELIGDSPFTVTVEPLAARVLVPRRR